MWPGLTVKSYGLLISVYKFGRVGIVPQIVIVHKHTYSDKLRVKFLKNLITFR